MPERRFTAVETTRHFGRVWAVEGRNGQWIASGMSERTAKRVARLLNEHGLTPGGRPDAMVEGRADA